MIFLLTLDNSQISKTGTSWYVEQICRSLKPTKLASRKLKHLGRSNKFFGPLEEFLSITRIFLFQVIVEHSN